MKGISAMTLNDVQDVIGSPGRLPDAELIRIRDRFAAHESAEIAKLRKALEFYVDTVTLVAPDWWDWAGMGGGPTMAQLEKEDIGAVAREALGI